MRHLDEGTIHAWLDGALAPNEASAAEAHVQSCEECGRAVAEARGLIAASSRILGALDDVPAVQAATGAAGTLSLPAARDRRRSWWRRGGIGYAAAATALLAVGTTLVWSRLSPDTAMDTRATTAIVPAPVAATSQVIGDSLASKRAADSRPPVTDLARDAANDVKNVVPAATSAKLSDKQTQPAKEELAKDIVVPLPGPMPRPAAPKSTPPVRQEAERKALADAAANTALSVRPAQVLGRVLDAATGAPVVGALVSVDSTRAQTDSSGKFQLQAVPLGNQTVRVRALGFQPAVHPVAVAASDSVQLAFALQKSVASLEQVVTTGTAAAAQQDRRDSRLRREAERSQAAQGQGAARLSAARSPAESVAGCYTVRAIAQDKARDEDRAIVASLPTRVQLESEPVDRSRANEQSPNRARTLAGNVRAESWRMVGDSLEVTLVDGDRRTALRFARRDTRWISAIAIMERCSSP
ncbi:MAG TPA: carboxypeptidase regulatory-like domain-containing protein [Gemmatimonadaceae bacterium]